MKILLMQDIKSLGKTGDIKEVKDGYGKNFLIKKGLAKLATNEVINRYKSQIKKAQINKQESIAESEKLATRLKSLQVIIKHKAGSGDSLYGSITKNEIAEHLSSQHNIDIDKKNILLEEPIKKIGIVDISIKLEHNIKATLSINVQREDA